MDHMIKDCPLLKEEQRRNSKKQQELASKAFKKAMKATWGETSDEESEGEDGEGNMTLMAKSDMVSTSESSEKTENSKLKETVSSLKDELNTIKDKKASRSELSNNDQGLHEAEIVSLKKELCKEKKINSELQVSTPALNEGTLLETDSLNVPSEPRKELKNSGGTNYETVHCYSGHGPRTSLVAESLLTTLPDSCEGCDTCSISAEIAPLHGQSQIHAKDPLSSHQEHD
ncbi:hypothetical protein HAX54_039264 [Datura stramonium]|uniref:Uncharacterized protein n=1 Tax=Datura stramonium TaxID=4076 RepID=A0ABS8VMI3_DATST|nr:hypothetical protein [Datura stramonium]